MNYLFLFLLGSRYDSRYQYELSMGSRIKIRLLKYTFGKKSKKIVPNLLP